ncbi:hypothetical protein ACFPM7_05060 [Actinokineospora guangxiensis]|uniref:Uncharacterized protein n=1 Tax=Actinokineospora guangxiensis TaxID=1490288 RepID=A0ABW0EG91_9PSEU
MRGRRPLPAQARRAADYLDKANRSLNAAADAPRRWHADLVPMQRAANDLEAQARAALERLRSADPAAAAAGW